MNNTLSAIDAHNQSQLPASTIITKILLTLITLGVISLITRLITTPRPSDHSREDQAVSPPVVPYWLPILGHIPDVIINADKFFQRLRDRYRGGAFSLNFGGTQHNIVYSPELVTALLNQRSADADFDDLGVKITHNVFGLSKDIWVTDRTDLHELFILYKYLQSEPNLSQIVQVTVDNLKANVKDLVTGNESPVDMMPWERAANVTLNPSTTRQNDVEVDLFALIRDFVGHLATPSLFGTDFLEKFPDFLGDLWKLDHAFLLMTTGLPRWAPVPSVTQAHISRKRMIERLSEFHRAMDLGCQGINPGVDWANLDNVSTLVKTRTEIYRKYGHSMENRAAIDIGLMWATNANSNALVFWLVARIFSDKALLEMIREEIEPHLRVVQPAKELAFAEPPRIDKLDLNGICTQCALLKSCYIECLRLDTATSSLKIAQRDFTLMPRAQKSPAYRIRKGQYCHAAHSLYNLDPTVFANPDSYKADRHIKRESEHGQLTADQGSIRAFGGGATMCKGRAFAYKEVMVFAAAIIAMWDMEPAHGQEWSLPPKRRATGVYMVKHDIRVRLRYRGSISVEKTLS